MVAIYSGEIVPQQDMIDGFYIPNLHQTLKQFTSASNQEFLVGLLDSSAASVGEPWTKAVDLRQQSQEVWIYGVPSHVPAMDTVTLGCLTQLLDMWPTSLNSLRFNRVRPRNRTTSWADTTIRFRFIYLFMLHGMTKPCPTDINPTVKNVLLFFTSNFVITVVYI